MLPKIYNPKDVEPAIQKFWRETNIFGFDNKSNKPIFAIDTPPPTISGLIHVGHAMSYSQAEFIARFKRMSGFNVFYPMGFDDNGIASERYVEKIRNVKASDIPRNKFIEMCLEETRKGGEEFRRVWESMGISVDWSTLYSTINPLCQKISQLSFLELLKKDIAYKAEAPVTWCPTCRTAVAQAELEDLQRTTELNYISFETEDKKNIIIATTRPELLAACVAIFVNPQDKRYKDLIGRLASIPIFGHKVKIFADESVDMAFGTGIVMMCTFGDKADVEWWQKYKLPLKIVLDESGRLTKEAGEFAGMKTDEARKQIISKLKEIGALVDIKKIEQTVNVHERCNTPIEFFTSMQWWIKIADMKEKWLELGNKIKWYPAHMKNRYDTWVRGLNSNWCISRQRYFGIPFPVWYCKKCGKIKVADEDELPVDPFITQPKAACSCGSRDFEPDRDVMDTWATSSLTPLIVARWKENNNLMNKIYPMSLRPQGHDIIRTWAFYTIVRCWLHTGEVPWSVIMINGHGLDAHGKKMSKSKGNVIEPLEVIEKYSSDALRYWAASAKLGHDLPYQEKDVARGQKIIVKLWNAARLVESALEGWDGNKGTLKPIDIWLLTRLKSTISRATHEYENYEYAGATSVTEQFFWHDFCDNYLEIVKSRIYSRNDSAVQWVLYHAFLSIIKLFAPVLAHVTEEIYQKLFRSREKIVSIHISSWPSGDIIDADENIEKKGNVAINIISAIRQWKHKQRLALNTSVREVVLDCPTDTREGLKEFLDDIKNAMKIESLKFGIVNSPVFEVDGMKVDINV